MTVSLSQGISQLLNATAGVSELLGQTPGIFPVILPEESLLLPVISLQQISAIGAYTLKGPIGLFKARLQVDTWAESYASAQQLVAAIAAVLDGYAGTLPNGVRVAGTNLEGLTDYVDSGSRLYRVQQDWLFLHTAS
jgi:hypothetical protein